MAGGKAADRVGSKGIQSVEISYRLLKPFIASPGPFTLTNLAQAAGMTPTKAHFYLVSLVRVGLLARSGNGGTFSLGPAALHLGLAALAQIDVVQAAQEPMQQLRDTTGLPTFLSVWAENGPTIVLHFHGLRTSSWSMQVGAVLSPLTATGRALLAYAPPAKQREVVERELARALPEDPWYRATAEDMMQLLAEIRRTGISPRSGAVVPGFSGISAAIIDHEGAAAAAITIIGDTRYFDDAPGGSLATALAMTTRSISHAVGGRAAEAPSASDKAAVLA
ncbi:MAG TPA: IclR family transcriptional regulator [Stellaceae bacterium]|nr:IclR family transcriptional regulator [Stellaceae bacterium]